MDSTATVSDNSCEVQADDKVMPNHKKQQSRKSKGGRKVLEALNVSGNRYEVLGDDEQMQNDDVQEQSGRDKMEGGNKSEELLNSNGLSAKAVESGMRNMILKPENCTVKEYYNWIADECEGMNHNALMAFLDSQPRYRQNVPEDNQWRLIEGPNYTITYPPPHLRDGKGPNLRKLFAGKKLSKVERDITEDKKTCIDARDEVSSSSIWADIFSKRGKQKKTMG